MTISSFWNKKFASGAFNLNLKILCCHSLTQSLRRRAHRYPLLHLNLYRLLSNSASTCLKSNFRVSDPLFAWCTLSLCYRSQKNCENTCHKLCISELIWKLLKRFPWHADNPNQLDTFLRIWSTWDNKGIQQNMSVFFVQNFSPNIAFHTFHKEPFGFGRCVEGKRLNWT